MRADFECLGMGGWGGLLGLFVLGEEAGSYLERASALEAEFRETLRRFGSGTLSR